MFSALSVTVTSKAVLMREAMRAVFMAVSATLTVTPEDMTFVNKALLVLICAAVNCKLASPSVKLNALSFPAAVSF